MPCLTSALLKNLQYLDLSDNLLSDMTLKETLCDGNGTMKDLRVLNISGNALQVPSWNLEEFFLPVSEKSKKGLKVSVLEKNAWRLVCVCPSVFFLADPPGAEALQADPPGC